MTEFQALLRAIEARGKDVARQARARAAATLIVAATAADIPAEMADGDVVLAARGLRARANGSRRRLPDPVVQSLVRR